MVENSIFEADNGVIYNVLKLFAEFKTQEAINLLTQVLFELVKEEFPKSKIFINSGYSDGTHLEADEIEAKINVAFLSSEWTYRKIIRRIRASCFSPHRTHMPDRDRMTTEEIAEHFQVK